MDKKPAIKTERYNQVRDTLDTGDIVLFSSSAKTMKIWKFFTETQWTHIGMVVNDSRFKQMLLWESVLAEGLCNVDTYENKKGVQCVLLSHKVRGYKGKMAIRRLKINKKERNKLTKYLIEFRKEVRNKDYEKFRSQILKAFCDEFSKDKYKEKHIFWRLLRIIVVKYWGLNKENIEDLSSIFCSELIAEAYQRAGLLKKKPPEKEEEKERLEELYQDIIFDPAADPSNEYTPEDFSEQGTLVLENNKEFESELRVIY